MALINTLRRRMGKIVVGVVALAMFAFILTDLLQSNSTLLGGNDTTIAEIGGDDISYQQFQEKVEQLSYTFAVNNGRNPSSEEMETVRTQAWNALILENAYQSQFNALGITVTDEEIIDMVQGNNIDPQIRQFFTDPNTGQFSRDNVVAFLQQINQAPPQQRASWLTFEETLRPNRLLQKYENLITMTDYVTTAEAKFQHQAQESNMSVDYLYVPFFSVADSLVQISKSEMESYLSANADQYQREESRSVKYVVFPVRPSAEDSAYVTEEIRELRQGLINAQNDSTYANLNSDGPNPFRTIADPGLVPEGLVGQETGTVTEPVIVGNRYAVSKLSDVTTADESFVKVRHILIETDGTSPEAKADAKEKANDIIRQLQRGADFAELAAANSADRSNAFRGGDLGWVGENGSFVQPFKDAIFDFNKTGLIPRPVETSFGYHVIQVDEPETNKVYKVATIEKEFFASDETLNEIYRQADLLAANSDGEKSFEENANEAGLNLRTATNIKKNDSRLTGVGEARRVVLWLYNDASVGKVSEVFELDNNYVVAVMTGKQPEGTASLSQVETEVRGKVLNQKKTDYIKDKLSSVSNDDFEAMKEAYGEEARTGQADISLNSNSFSGIGFAPKAVGVAFSLEEGEKTAPFGTENGVIALRATAKSMAEPQEDYSSYKQQVQSERQARKTTVANFPLSFYPVMISEKIHNAVKEFAEIEDMRYKFF